MVAHVGQALLDTPPHVVPHDDLGRVKYTEVSSTDPEAQFELPQSEGEGEEEHDPGEVTQQHQGVHHQKHQPRPGHSVQTGAAVHTEKQKGIISTS